MAEKGSCFSDHSKEVFRTLNKQSEIIFEHQTWNLYDPRIDKNVGCCFINQTRQHNQFIRLIV